MAASATGTTTYLLVSLRLHPQPALACLRISLHSLLTLLVVQPWKLLLIMHAFRS